LEREGKKGEVNAAGRMRTKKVADDFWSALSICFFNENITGLLSPPYEKNTSLFSPWCFRFFLLSLFSPRTFGWSKASQHTTKSLHLYKQMVSTIPQVTENSQKTNDARFKKPREKRGSTK